PPRQQRLSRFPPPPNPPPWKPRPKARPWKPPPPKLPSWPPPNPPSPRANASWLGSIRAPASSATTAIVNFLPCLLQLRVVSTPLQSSFAPPFSQSLLFVMFVSFSVGVMRALAPRSLRRLAWRGLYSPHATTGPVTWPCSARSLRFALFQRSQYRSRGSIRARRGALAHVRQYGDRRARRIGSRVATRRGMCN